MGTAVIEAAEGIQASEQLALAHHVVRRKLVLELLDKLLLRLRERDGKPDDNQLEKTLHTIICPMRVRGDDPQELRSRAHDLWVVDERFAFTRAFSSDKRLDKILREGGGADRPDLLVWDLAFGMSATAKGGGNKADLSEPLQKMLVVEFKKPGRRDYPDAKDQIEQQVLKYLAQLKGGEMECIRAPADTDCARLRIPLLCGGRHCGGLGAATFRLEDDRQWPRSDKAAGGSLQRVD